LFIVIAVKGAAETVLAARHNSGVEVPLVRSESAISMGKSAPIATIRLPVPLTKLMGWARYKKGLTEARPRPMLLVRVK
jgi:hypothetical protein